MKHFLTFFFGFICFLPASCMSEKESSVFTSVNTRNCRAILQQKAEEEDIIEAEEEEIVKEVKDVFECKGVKGYRLYIVDDGARSWYVLRHAKKGIISFEQDIVYKQNILGDFPNVGGKDDVEWILDKRGVPSGLIFSVSSQVSDKETGRFKIVARYFAVKLNRGGAPMIAGVAKTQNAVKELLKASH